MSKVKATIVYTKYTENPPVVGDTRYKVVELEVPDDELAPKITSIGIEDITKEENTDRSVRFPAFWEPLFDGKDINRLTGKLMTYIDATFQDVDQRRAHKDIVKQTVWSWQHDLRDRAKDEQSWASSQQ